MVTKVIRLDLNEPILVYLFVWTPSAPQLRINHYVQKMGGIAQMNNRHRWKLKKSKSCGRIFSIAIGAKPLF